MLGRDAGQFICPKLGKEERMAGSTIKGITAEISGDITKLEIVLKEGN